MRQPEQLTVEQITTTATLGDIALYGGLVAIGVVAGIYIAVKLVQRAR